jgi:2-keto-myo-inositol isomerase
MSTPIRFAINRISAPNLSYADFAAMSQRLGVGAVEIRNDLKGVELTDGTPARQVADATQGNGLTLRSINALQRFEQFDAAREAEAVALAKYAVESGTQALVLCPTNDLKDARPPEQRHADLVNALRKLQPILADHGLTGLVEPLGFEECAVRRKSQAVRAFEELGAEAKGTFKLVHDTFHHHLAGEGLFFADWTGLVHISGVDDKAVTVADMRDGHRVLVGSADRLGNVAQLRTLFAAGYAGFASFEPFAAEIAAAKDIEQRLASSMAFLQDAVSAATH